MSRSTCAMYMYMSIYTWTCTFTCICACRYTYLSVGVHVAGSWAARYEYAMSRTTRVHEYATNRKLHDIRVRYVSWATLQEYLMSMTWAVVFDVSPPYAHDTSTSAAPPPWWALTLTAWSSCTKQEMGHLELAWPRGQQNDAVKSITDINRTNNERYKWTVHRSVENICN